AGQHQQGKKSAHAREIGQRAQSDFAEPENGRTRLRHEIAGASRRTQNSSRFSRKSATRPCARALECREACSRARILRRQQATTTQNKTPGRQAAGIYYI